MLVALFTFVGTGTALVIWYWLYWMGCEGTECLQRRPQAIYRRRTVGRRTATRKFLWNFGLTRRNDRRCSMVSSVALQEDKTMWTRLQIASMVFMMVQAVLFGIGMVLGSVPN
jgi:hypothetical protein